MRGCAAFFLALLLLMPVLEAVVRIEGPFPARDGETCIVCNGRVSQYDRAYVIGGQRVAVMRDMESQLFSNPRKYAGRLQPRGLMTSSEKPAAGSNALLYGGVYVLAGLVCGALCAHMAMAKGLSAWRWFGLGFLFSLLACAWLGAHRPTGTQASGSGLEKIRATREPVRCPHCTGTNHPAAAKCSHCGAALEPSAPSEPAVIRAGR
jgi:hypothetical protein